MDSIVSDDAGSGRRRSRFRADVKGLLRDLRIQLSMLNHQVGSRAELRDGDLDCLDLIARFGPVSPSTLARRAGLHPATVTGILDRLERGGWIVRERDTSDRRAMVIRPGRQRTAELFRLYAGMNRSMDEICDSYTEAELELIADFLRRVADAGQRAASELNRD